jgi:hypothetical protein
MTIWSKLLERRRSLCQCGVHSSRFEYVHINFLLHFPRDTRNWQTLTRSHRFCWDFNAFSVALWSILSNDITNIISTITLICEPRDLIFLEGNSSKCKRFNVSDNDKVILRVQRRPSQMKLETMTMLSILLLWYVHLNYKFSQFD